MASANSVIDLKNETAQNEIWREHCRKEDGIFRTPAPFRIDAKGIRPMPIVPHRMNPHQMHHMDINNDGNITAEETRRYNDILVRLEALKQQDLNRSSSSRRFGTSVASEYGMMMMHRPQSSQLARTTRKWTRGKSQCDITTYASSYASTKGRSPFARSTDGRS